MRLNDFDFLKMDSREFALFIEAIDKLERYRNRLQHLSLSADPDVIARILGIALPRAIDLLDAIPRHHPVLGDIFFDEPIKKTLEKDFPDVVPTVQLLRSNYDCLIEQAVAFFKGNVFHDLKLELRIDDHGAGFWGPPDLKADGFINFRAERFARPPLKGEPVSRIEEYAAGTQVSDPEYTGMNVFPFEGHLKGSLTFRGEIKFRKAEGLLVLPGSEEKVPFVRDLTLIIDASLVYEANGMKGSGHFDIREIQQSTGKLTIMLAAIPKGYTGEKPKIIGKFESLLNPQNAAFRLHCFLEPEGAIRDQNRILEWKINGIGDLIFE